MLCYKGHTFRQQRSLGGSLHPLRGRWRFRATLNRHLEGAALTRRGVAHAFFGVEGDVGSLADIFHIHCTRVDLALVFQDNFR